MSKLFIVEVIMCQDVEFNCCDGSDKMGSLDNMPSVEVRCGPVSGGDKLFGKRRVAGGLSKGFDMSSSEFLLWSALKKRQVKQLTKRPTKRLIKPVDKILS